MKLELGRVYKVRDFSKEDLSKYRINGKLQVRRYNHFGISGIIGFNKSFIGAKLMHVDAPQKYPSVPYMCLIKPLQGYYRLLYVPEEFIETTQDRIIDIRNIDIESRKYIIKYLALTDDRKATYNIHGRHIDGTLKEKSKDLKWFSENAVGMFLYGAPQEGIINTLLRATNQGNISTCKQCGYRKTHAAIVASLSISFKYVCPNCKKMLYIAINDKGCITSYIDTPVPA
ncbi:MAG: hypothetical protein KAS32_17740 [Candidatus Peribacteraceae bacterium]|nr:hypothetical protein [Candidatus Peribacteraceae bacterium]